MKYSLHIFLLVVFLMCTCFDNYAQLGKTIYYTVDVKQKDTIVNITLPEVSVFAPLKFKNEKERLAYSKLVRDVKIALPYARKVSQSIIETYEMMMTFEKEKERQKYLEKVQKSIIDEYKPKLKKMTSNQGRILVKLIDRETNSSSYDIVKSMIGSFKAGFYNTFAKMFGNNLKTRYEPEGKDWMIERIVTEIDQDNI